MNSRVVSVLVQLLSIVLVVVAPPLSANYKQIADKSRICASLAAAAGGGPFNRSGALCFNLQDLAAPQICRAGDL